MTFSLKSLARAAAFGVVMLTAGAAPAQAQTPWPEDQARALMRCVDVILLGPAQDDISIRGEGFDCKPLGEITIKNGIVQVHGSVSHRLTLRPDEDVDFTFSIRQDGSWAHVKWTIEQEFASDLGREYDFTIAPAEESLTGLPLLTYWTEHGATNKDWVGTSVLMIDLVGIELVRSFKNHNAAPAFNFDRPGHDIRHFELSDGARYGAYNIDKRYPRTYVDACASSCDQDGQCRAWTLTRKVSGLKAPLCWLKGDGSRAELNRDTVSGLKPLPKLPPIKAQIFKPKGK